MNKAIIPNPNIFFAIDAICTTSFTPAPIIEMINHKGINNTCELYPERKENLNYIKQYFEENQTIYF